MRKITFLLLLSTLMATAQYKEPAQLSGESLHELYVVFDKSIDFDVARNCKDQLRQIPGMADIFAQYDFDFEKGVALSEEKLDAMEAAILKNSTDVSSIKTLRNTLLVKMNQPQNAPLLALARELEKLPQVVSCNLVATQPVQPPTDIPPATTDMEVAQTYIAANPGVNMRYAWDLGLNGNGIRIRDVEYGFNKNHEEFADNSSVYLAPDMTISTEASVDFTEHGTAVFGIVYADKGTYGVSGMAHGAQEMVLFPEWQQSGYNRVAAVTQAIANSAPGDVIIYEMQIDGPNGTYVPAEYNLSVWNLTKAATDAGIIVVAAAGNGNEDLDSAPYLSYRNRGNSGAIIVGGGTATTAHNKISYSTYGSRVDVQAWATNVRSSGYGNFLQVNGDFNQSYTNFSGTSSATPIVASCAIVLQSYYHGLTGNYLSSVEMRDLLIATGIAQGSGGHIGPIPDMQAAIEAINLLGVKQNGKDNLFTVYPNPVTDKAILVVPGFSGNEKVVLFNALGQQVYSQALRADKTVDMSAFPSGVYFLQLTGNARTATQKIIKN